MSDEPVRWLDGGGGSDRARALLASAAKADPPEHAERAVWAALLGRLPPPDPGGGGLDGGAGGAAAGGGLLGVLKAAGVGAIGGVLVSSAALLAGDVREPAAPAPPAAPVAVVVSPAPVPPAEARPKAALPAPEPARVVPSAVTPKAPPTASVAALDPSERQESQLVEESRALSAARNALRRGDAAGALATVEAVRARFPASVLGQEREALTIQALAQAGQRDAARARARAFLAKFPESPHATSLARHAE